MSLALGEPAPRPGLPPTPRARKKPVANTPSLRSEQIAILKALGEDPARVAAVEIEETEQIIATAPGGVTPALDLLAAIRRDRPGDDSWISAFVHAGAPHSKARPRWSPKNGRTYTPTETAQAERSLAKRFERSFQGRVLEGNVAIAAVFYRPNHQRIDADNLMKLVLDAGTKAGAWLDDSQITAQACVVEVDAANPRTVIAIGPTASTMNRTGVVTAICKRCGKGFTTPRMNPRLTCSRACAKPRVMGRCASCESEFRRRRAGQRYCSKSCSSRESTRLRQKAGLQRSAPTCVTCGGRVSRREYRQCATCATAGRPLGSKNRPPTLGLVEPGEASGISGTVRAVQTSRIYEVLR
jgi:Holliday junction resolvase RusA-like endonuclease